MAPAFYKDLSSFLSDEGECEFKKLNSEKAIKQKKQKYIWEKRKLPSSTYT